jgi:tetratricopeptide (TPR) repeat protein
MNSARSAASACQGAALLVAALGLLAAGLHVYGTVREEGAFYMKLVLASGGPAAAYLMGGFGLGAILWGVAAMLSRRPEAPRQLYSSIEEVTSAIAELQATVQSVGMLRSSDADQPASAAPPSQAAGGDAGLGSVAGRMIELLEEIREISLMDETQRQARLAQLMERRKRAGLEQLSRLIADKRWADAEAAVTSLAKQFPSDADVVRARAEFEQKRDEAERTLIAETRQKIDGLIAVSSWDEAVAVMSAFLKMFPGSVEGQLLYDRVSRERTLFVDSTTQRLYEEIRSDSERRNWKRALATARRLVEKFPDHPTAQKVRDQLDTLRENAEVQERKETEQQIQQLIRSRRYEEAIPLAEEFLVKYPTAKQAATIQELLPKLREKVNQATAAAPAAVVNAVVDDEEEESDET